MKTPTPTFCPDSFAETVVVGAINAAKKQIRIAMYVFTSRPILKALLAAKSRGVNVAVIVDAVEAITYHVVPKEMVGAGVPVFIDAHEPKMHLKFTVVDRKTVLTGSFNYTKEATQEANDVLVIDSPTLAKKYLDAWDFHQSHSGAFQ